ncbi:ROK family protein [Companilactobacillus huachuanensis]|uniref:ROK family protein n=1 Tax=Companilactobacillus huachuanensis TaxID=2559914 RepID=A0ABW1RIL9_9LACO|nr:ROK family protein [Companilactobacillus huachuanensis]
MKTGIHLSARQQNLQAILDLLDENEQLSAKELSALTGLSIVSINKLLGILLLNTAIITTDYINTRGRRAKIYRLNYDAYQLGIVSLVENGSDIKATYFLTNLKGEILQKEFNNQPITSVDQLTKFIKLQVTTHKPEKIIIGVPGAELNGYLQISDVKSLQGINLSLAIETATDIKTVVVNDANASTFGAAIELNESQNIAVGMYFPNNFEPGVGIVINNHLINGADGLAGEIEYSNINHDTTLSQQIIQHIQNIISFLNPNLIIVYAKKTQLSNLQTDQIKQTIQRVLPLHEKYRIDFERNFENDYRTGLATIGRHKILNDLITD